MKKIKILRAVHDITQVELARICNLSQSKLSLIERGLTEPSKEEENRIFDVLKLDDSIWSSDQNKC
jgi:transcriptional regulator with XRE-family HTH domain